MHQSLRQPVTTLDLPCRSLATESSTKQQGSSTGGTATSGTNSFSDRVAPEQRRPNYSRFRPAGRPIIGGKRGWTAAPKVASAGSYHFSLDQGTFPFPMSRPGLKLFILHCPWTNRAFNHQSTW